MEECIAQTEFFDQDDTVYLLDKAIWINYDMVQTRLKVIEFLQNYKRARAQYLGTLAGDWGLVSNIDISKVGSSSHNVKGFSEISDRRMDAEALLNATSPLIAKLKASFTEDEKLYYDYCLASNNSETMLCEIMRVSKSGLVPIKNSCLLKIAFATHNAVRKKNH